jgi:DNA-binding Lrp family transcriptional regulator
LVSFGFLGSYALKLTRRQEAFVHKLLDLYRELNGPIHYSVVAEQLGVSPFTAYDMLRRLEEKGIVSSDYQIGSAKPGPGRSEIVFWPTEQAHRLFKELAGGADVGDWATVKRRVLERVRKGEVRDRELAEDMLARVPPEGPDSLRYCIEVMTVVALRLRRSAGRKLLLKYLPRILAGQTGGTRASLGFLGGFALGVLANDKPEESDWGNELFAQVQRYEVFLCDMDDRLVERLAATLRQVFVPLMNSQ